MIKIGAQFRLREPLSSYLSAGSPAPKACPTYKDLTLRGFDVCLERAGRKYELPTTNALDGDGFHSRGLAFARRVVPLAPGMLLEQHIVLPNAGDTVGISWRLLGNKITAVRLTATPIFSSASRISREIFVFEAEHEGGRLMWLPFCRAGKIIADTNANCTEPALRIDSDGRENTSTPSTFVFDLGRTPALLLLSVELPTRGAVDPLMGEFLAHIAKSRSEDSNLGADA